MRIEQTHIDYIRSLEQQGRITPEAILADARRLESPLHDLYDWSLEAAAERHWLEHTREIIRRVRVIYTLETTTYKVPVYVQDPLMGPKQQGYVSLDQLKREPENVKKALVEECNRAVSVVKRVQALASALDREDEVAEILSSLLDLRQSVLVA